MGSAFLDAYGHAFGRCKRRYLALLQRGQLARLSRREQRARVCGDQLAYRQFKGVEETVKGMLASRKTNHSHHIITQSDRVARAKKAAARATAKLASAKANSRAEPACVARLAARRYQKQRGLNVQADKLQRLQQQGAFSFCFGGKTLLTERVELADRRQDGTISDTAYQQAVADWRQRWEARRSDEVFLVGSCDEVAGNGNCQLVVGCNGQPDRLRVRVPKPLVARFGEWVWLPVRLPLYREQLVRACHADTPLSYRFKRRDGRWQVLITFRFAYQTPMTTPEAGILGVDFNVDHFAVTRVDANGNVLKTWRVPLALRGKTQAQRDDIIGKAIAAIVREAQRLGCDIAIEQLDFRQKKKALSEMSPAMARLLSAFATQRVSRGFTSRCHRERVGLHVVPAAYSSQLGQLKYADRYGLTVHQAAAMVIARRALGMKEKAPRYLLRLAAGKVYLLRRQELIHWRPTRWQSLIDKGLDRHNYTVAVSTTKALRARSGSVLLEKKAPNPDTTSDMLSGLHLSQRRLMTIICHAVKSPQMRASYLALT